MRRNKNQQGISKIIEEPEIELKNDSFSIWDYLHAFFWVVLIVTLVVPVYAAITNPPSRSLTTWLLIAYIVLDLIITIVGGIVWKGSDKVGQALVDYVNSGFSAEAKTPPPTFMSGCFSLI